MACKPTDCLKIGSRPPPLGSKYMQLLLVALSTNLPASWGTQDSEKNPNTHECNGERCPGMQEFKNHPHTQGRDLEIYPDVQDSKCEHYPDTQDGGCEKCPDMQDGGCQQSSDTKEGDKSCLEPQWRRSSS